jgi:hypothetical protein
LQIDFLPGGVVEVWIGPGRIVAGVEAQPRSSLMTPWMEEGTMRWSRLPVSTEFWLAAESGWVADWGRALGRSRQESMSPNTILSGILLAFSMRGFSLAACFWNCWRNWLRSFFGF